MNWVLLILAGVFEMIGVLMINKLHKDRNFLSIFYLLGGFGLSFFFLNLVPWKHYQWEQPMPSGPVLELRAGPYWV